MLIFIRIKPNQRKPNEIFRQKRRIGKNKKYLLICGSYVEIMKLLLEENNPLYGRFDPTLIDVLKKLTSMDVVVKEAPINNVLRRSVPSI